MSEAELDDAMNEYAKGRTAAFDVLHRGLERRIRAYLERRGVGDAMAADLAQETFLRVHRARSAFVMGSAVTPWVYAIARNVFVDHLRRTRDERATLCSLLAEPSADPRAVSGEEAAVALSTLRQIDRVLTALPPSQREAFLLVRWEGLTPAEAGARLGVSAMAVKLRAFRAQSSVRAELDPPAPEDAPRPTLPRSSPPPVSAAGSASRRRST